MWLARCLWLWLRHCLRLGNYLRLGRCRLRGSNHRRSLRSDFALAVKDGFSVAWRHALHARCFAHFASGLPFRAGRDRNRLRRCRLGGGGAHSRGGRQGLALR